MKDLNFEFQAESGSSESLILESPSEEGETFGTLWHYCQLKWVSIICPKLHASMVRTPI